MSESGKTCSRCKQLKPLHDFYHGPGYHTGVSYTCKDCDKGAASIAQKRNPDAQRARNRRAAAKLRQERPDVVKARNDARRHWEAEGNVTVADLKGIYEEAGGLCTYCGKAVQAKFRKIGPRGFDHVIPRSRGGRHDADNMVVSCVDCNRAKGSRELEVSA